MKINKNSFLIIISCILIVAILGGMIVTTVLLSNRQQTDWDYYAEQKMIEYYYDSSVADDYTFKCINSFKSALKSYFSSKQIMTILGLDKKIDVLVERIVVAFQQAQVPASRLEVIANVINENKIPTLLNNITFPFTDIDSFNDWTDHLAISITDYSLFELIGKFIASFLNATTLTEDEAARVLYQYLSTYGSDQYKAVLILYGKENFIHLFSDTFFAIRTLFRSTDQKGISLSVGALRSSLYQLGKIYLSISKINNNTEFESLFGFPKSFPTEKYIGREDSIQECYQNVYGSLGNLFFFFGNLLVSFTSQELSYYYEYLLFNNQYNDTIRLYKYFKDTETITEEQEATLNKLLFEQKRYRVLAANAMTKTIMTAMGEYSDETYDVVILSLKEKMLSMRLLLSDLSDTTQEALDAAVETYEQYCTLIEEDSSQLLIGLDHFKDTDWTKDSLEDSGLLESENEYALSYEKGSELLELYFTSLFTIWMMNKKNEWGLDSRDE